MQGLINMLYAAELILGRDRFRRNYPIAFHAGRIVAQGLSGNRSQNLG